MMFSRTARHVCAIAVWALLAALSACGPGVVGTGSGTDDGGNDDPPYVPSGLCTAPFAQAALACSSDVGDPTRGTSPVHWADANKANEGALVLALLQANGMSLEVPCKQLSFAGKWGQLPDGTLAFIGRYVSTDASNGQPAIAHVEAAPAEPGAVGWLRLDDPSGSALFGPWLVRRVDGGEVAFNACGP
jgi:hypothetical protein